MATKKATGSAKKGPPKGVQRSGDAGTKGTGSAGIGGGKPSGAKKGPPKGVQRVGDRGTKGTGSAGLTASKKPGGAKKSPR